MRKPFVIFCMLIFSAASLFLISGCPGQYNADAIAKKIKKGMPKEKEMALRMDLAYALDNEKRYDEAVKEYDKIIASGIKKYQFMAKNNKGNTLYKMEKYGDALKIFQEILKNPPQDKFKTLLHNNIAHCYHGMKQFDEALKEYNIALDLNPNNREAKIGLGYLKQDMQKAAAGGGSTAPKEEAAPATGTAPVEEKAAPEKKDAGGN